MAIIQFDELEKVILDIEQVYKKHNLGQEEVQLLIRQMQIRLNSQQTKQRVADAQSSINVPDLMKQFMNNKGS